MVLVWIFCLTMSK